MKLTLLLGLLAFMLLACNPVKEYHEEISGLGYIPYPSPMETSGPGTLVGGTPKSLSWVAGPESCFPRMVNEVPTNLRRIDKTTVPNKERKITTSGKASVDFINALNTGSPFFKIGAKFSKVQTMAISMKGVHIEYIDTLYLMNFYNNQLSQTCKDLLDNFAFIIQALKVSELEFKFFDRSGASLDLSVNNIKQILDIEAGVDFIVEKSTSLIIKTPKYIGYQLGRWRPGEERPLYRASKTRFGKWLFENISVFGDSKTTAQKLRMDENLELQQLISNENSIDEFSKY